MAIKQINVSFQYDAETDVVSNIITTVDGVKQVKKTTKTKEKLENVVMEDASVITLDDSRLIFNNLSINTLGIDDSTRIVIKYEKDKKTKITFPVIGTDMAFDAEGTGNKITQPKTGEYKGKTTMLFKGKSNVFLKGFGSSFTLEEYEEGIYKLIPLSGGNKNISAESLEDSIKESLEVESELIIDNNDTYEIDNYTFQL